MFDLVGLFVLGGMALTTLVLVIGFGGAGKDAGPARSPNARVPVLSPVRLRAGRVRLKDD